MSELVFVYKKNSMMPICAEILKDAGIAVLVRVMYYGAMEWSEPQDAYRDTQGRIWLEEK